MTYAENNATYSKKTRLYHYTMPSYVQEIISSGFIELELHRNIDELIEAANDNILGAKIMLESIRSIGRYVWFTTASSSPATRSHSNVRFSFFAEDIGAEKWSSVKRRHIDKMGSRAFDAIASLEQSALNLGEDPKNWWVCLDRVPVTKSHFDATYKHPNPPSFADCMTLSQLIQKWRRHEMRDATRRTH